MYRIILITTVLALLTACNWVEIRPEGQNVRVRSGGQTGQCNRIGVTNSETSARVLFFPRGSEQVQEELLILARNEAGLMGGNTIVPDSVVNNGRQRFVVYSCP